MKQNCFGGWERIVVPTTISLHIVFFQDGYGRTRLGSWRPCTASIAPPSSSPGGVRPRRGSMSRISCRRGRSYDATFLILNEATARALFPCRSQDLSPKHIWLPSYLARSSNACYSSNLLPCCDILP